MLYKSCVRWIEILVVTVLMCLYLGAEDTSPKKPLVIATEQEKRGSVSLIQTADFISLEITIKSIEKNPDIKFKELAEARQLLLKQAQEHEKIQVPPGPVMPGPSTIDRSETKFPSYLPNSESSQTVLHLLIPLSQIEDEVINAGREIRQLVFAQKSPGNSLYSWNMSKINLLVRDPESYRDQLIRQIKDQITHLKSILGDQSTIKVTGLESPVYVRQVSGRLVELFLDYKISFETGN